MAIKCPNINHPDWKALVEQHGNDGALKRYIENDYNIPNVDGSKVSNRRKVDVNHSFGAIRDTFRSKSTLDSLNKHPKKAAEMIDELQNRFPWVKISKDGLFDDDGNWLEVPPNKEGRHYRGAITSAVAWSVDSHFETPPHEFAHEYIEMYADTDLVKEAIKEHGSKERVVTLIGRKYAGQKMGNKFNQFVDKLWKMIRNTFGSPSVIDILTDSFAKNERLGTPLSRGTAIHNFQDTQKPNYNQDSVMDYNEEISSGVGENKVKSLQDVLKEIRGHFQTVIVDNQEKWAGAMRGFYNALTEKVRMSTTDKVGNVHNYAGVDVKMIEKVRVVLNNDESAIKIANAIKGEDVSLSSEERMALDQILKLQRTYDHRSVINNSIIDKKGNRVDSDTVINVGKEEVETSINKRRKLLNSKNKYLRSVGELINKGLSQVTNTRLWTKYLSGGENTILSKLAYKQLNDAREQFAEFRYAVNVKAPQSLIEGSSFHNPKSNINELETTEITLDPNINPELAGKYGKIKLTNAELLSIYLMNRQEDKKGDLRSGIYLEAVPGREYALDDMFMLSESQIKEIQNNIESNPATMELVNEIDNVMEYSYDKVNSQFRLLEGYDMDKYENYFPTYHGAQTTGMPKKKNLIDDMRSLMSRVPDAGPIRIADPFRTMATAKMTNASYYAYAVPIHNAQKVVTSLSKSFENLDDVGYIKAIQGSIDKIQDSGTLYSTYAEGKWSKIINKLQGNFSVALLAKNLGVVLKQQVSLETATNEINRKYIRKSGSSLGPVSFVNPLKLLKALANVGIKGGETWVPIEWRQLTNNADYQELIKYPLFRERFEGIVSKEAGEAIMGREIAEDKIKLPFLKQDGKPVYITKQRLMMGITIMDTLTIVRLYNAVKLETQDRMGEPAFAKMTPEQIEQHNVRRLQEIVDKTQPTFDQLNRTGMSQSSNPILRSLTMFSSATQKMGMGITESLIDYVNNPTAENGKRALGRLVSTGITTSAMLTTIDLLRELALRGLDDDDEIWDKYAWSSLQSSVGSIQGIGSVLALIISQLDDNPWYKTMQDPTQHIVQEGAEATANLFKGNWDKALKQGVGSYSKVKGLPFTLYSNTEKVIERVLE